MKRFSRQFRDKDEEFFNFWITVTSSDLTVKLGLGVDSDYMGNSIYSKHRIDWGDNTRPELISNTGGGFSSRLAHTYSSAGTYQIKVWTREKNLTIDKWMGDYIGTTNTIDVLDFSDFKNMYTFVLTGNYDTVTMPTEYNGNEGLRFQMAQGTQTFSDTLLDTTIWPSIESIGSSTGGSTNITRIKRDAVNADTTAFFGWSSSGLDAVGPNADDPANFAIDFDNYNIRGQFTARCGNATSFNIPSTSFSTISNCIDFYVRDYQGTSIDLSGVKMGTDGVQFNIKTGQM